jgi:hypothetical protein
MSLLAEMQAENAGEARRCLFGKILDAMTPNDQGDAQAALQSDISSSAICRVLNRRGHKLGDNVIRMHRAGVCCCGGESDGTRG